MALNNELDIGSASGAVSLDLDLETASTVTTTASSHGRSNEKIQEHVSLLEGRHSFIKPRCRTLRLAYVKHGLVASVWALSMLLAGYFARRLVPVSRYSYETGFETDLEPLRSSIAIKKVKFTGGLKFDENGTTYRAIDHTVTQYVGEPSPQLDRAWQALIRGQAVDLRGEEAQSVADITYQKPGGWYLTGPDAFHQLHCLDVIRKALRPDYYTPPNPEPLHSMHVDHCLDYLRQGVMCASDLTMIPVEWSSERNRILQQTEVVHTCRDFDRIHEWTLARDANAHPRQS